MKNFLRVLLIIGLNITLFLILIPIMVFLTIGGMQFAILLLYVVAFTLLNSVLVPRFLYKSKKINKGLIIVVAIVTLLLVLAGFFLQV